MTNRRLVDGKNPREMENYEPAKNTGRPKIPKELTPELIEKIVGPLRLGAPIPTAFELFDIPYVTLRYWATRAKEEPDSLYAELLNTVRKAVAEYEIRDLSVIDKHVIGAPAEYKSKPVLDSKGNFILDEKGKPMTILERDAEGNPILLKKEIPSDWRAAMERLSRRKPRYWAKTDQEYHDQILKDDESQAKSEIDVTPIETIVSKMIDKIDGDL
jgi:hypothetical protein